MVLSAIEREGNIRTQLRIQFGDLPGIRLAGVRYVETIGWLGPDKIFVVGNVNPRIDELRLFDLGTGLELEGQSSSLFATCRSEDRLAYLEPKGFEDPDQTVQVGKSYNTAPVDIKGELRFMFWDIFCRRPLRLSPGKVNPYCASYSVIIKGKP